MSLASLKEVANRHLVHAGKLSVPGAAQWNNEGCETPSAKDKVRRSPGVSSGRQATLSFLGRRLFFGGGGGDLKQIGLRLQPGCEGRCRKMTETAVWGFPPPGHVISVTPARSRSPHFQLKQRRKSSTFSWVALPWQLGSLPPPPSYFHRLHHYYAATLMSTLAASECSPIEFVHKQSSVELGSI